MLFDRLHPSQQVPNKSATTVPTRTDVYLYQETDGESDETYTPHMMGDSRLRHVEVRHMWRRLKVNRSTTCQHGSWLPCEVCA